MVAESSSEDEGPSGFDLDLGAFELVDSGLTAETLLSAEEPVSIVSRTIITVILGNLPPRHACPFGSSRHSTD